MRQWRFGPTTQFIMACSRSAFLFITLLNKFAEIRLKWNWNGIHKNITQMFTVPQDDCSQKAPGGEGVYNGWNDRIKHWMLQFARAYLHSWPLGVYLKQLYLYSWHGPEGVNCVIFLRWSRREGFWPQTNFLTSSHFRNNLLKAHNGKRDWIRLRGNQRDDWHNSASHVFNRHSITWNGFFNVHFTVAFFRHMEWHQMMRDGMSNWGKIS